MEPPILPPILSQPDVETTPVFPDATTDTIRSCREKPGILVLGSGGVKGLGIIGGLIALEQEGYLDSIHTIVGTSVGAVIGLLLVVGCSLYEIFELGLVSTVLCPWREMHKVDTTFTVTYGPIPHEKTVQPTVDIVMRKYGKIPTYKELYEITNKRLVMVSGCLNDRKPVYFDHITSPDMPCIAGMTASMLLAGILSKFMYNNKLYVDGAFVDPYACSYLDDGKEYIIGISVVGIDSDPNSSYATYLLSALTLSFDRIQELSTKHISDKVMTIELHLPDISIMDRGADINLRFKCFNAGYLQTMKSIAKIHGKSYEEYYGISKLPETFTPLPFHNVVHTSENTNQNNRFASALGRIPIPRLGRRQ